MLRDEAGEKETEDRSNEVELRRDDRALARKQYFSSGRD